MGMELSKNSDQSTDNVNSVEGVANLEDKNNRETREFSKRYSGFWRTKLAEKIREHRQNLAEKKAEAAALNQENAHKKQLIELRISALSEEIHNLRGEMIENKIILRQAKENILYKIADFLKIKNEKAEEKESFVEEAQSKIGEKEAELQQHKDLLGECAEIIIDDSELHEADKMLDEFYEQQENIREDFESEKENIRDVESLSKDNNALFLRAIPFGDANIKETSHKNENIDTEQMDGEQKSNLVLALEPTISVSSVEITDDIKQGTFYQTGLIIGEGTVLSAYDSDASTESDGVYSRWASYDKKAKSSVQDDFDSSLSKTMGASPNEHSSIYQRYNELVVENPKVSGAFVRIEEIKKDKILKEEHFKAELAKTLTQVLKVCAKQGLPLYNIAGNGEIINLLEMSDSNVSEIVEFTRHENIDEKIANIKQIVEEQDIKDEAVQEKISSIKENSAETEPENVSLTEKYKEAAGRMLFEIEGVRFANAILIGLERGYLNPEMMKEDVLEAQKTRGISAEGLEKMRRFLDDQEYGGENMTQIEAGAKKLLNKFDQIVGLSNPAEEEIN